MLGIGAAQQREPIGVAWKQNTEFEDVLKRLNESVGVDNTQGGEGESEYELKGDGRKEEIDSNKRVRRMCAEDGGDDDKPKSKRNKSKEKGRPETKHKNKKVLDGKTVSPTALVPVKNRLPPLRA